MDVGFRIRLPIYDGPPLPLSHPSNYPCRMVQLGTKIGISLGRIVNPLPSTRHANTGFKCFDEWLSPTWRIYGAG